MKKIKIALTNDAARKRALEVAKEAVPYASEHPELLSTWEEMARTAKVMKIDGREVHNVSFSS